MELGNPSLTGKLTFSSAVNLSGGARTVTAVSEVQFDGALTNGGFIKAGAALVTLAGANTYAGGTTISSNRLLITGSILDTGAFTLNGPTAIYTVDTAFKVGALTLTDGTIDGAGAVTGTSYTVSSGVISANLGGDVTLTKTGAGTVTLSGANTYTATVVNAGILLHAKPSALYNGDTGSWTKEKITVLNGGTLAFNVGGPGEFTVEDVVTTLRNNLAVGISSNGLRAGAKIGFDTSNFPGGNFELTDSIGNSTGLGAGALGIAKLGSNTMTLAVANTYTGETMVNGGLLLVNHANALTTGTTLTAGGTGTLDLNGYSFTVANLGVGGLGGTITDNAAGSVTNTLTVTAYTPALATFLTDGPTRKLALRVANNNNGNGFANNTNTFSGGLTLFGTNTRLNISVAPVNSGSAGSIVSSPFGRGTITLGETASDKAQLFFATVNNHTILNDIVFNTSLGTDVASSIRADKTGLTLAGTLTASLAPVTLGNNTAGATAFLTGQITGTNGLWLRGGYDMTVTLNNTTANPNNYEGTTTIDAGKKLVLGAPDQIPNGIGKGNLLNNGTFRLNGFNETINGLSGNGIVDSSGTATLTIGANDASSTFAGVVTNSVGALTMVKTGSGRITLLNPVSHSGGTIVQNGTLALPYRPVSASSPVTGMVRWFDASSSDNFVTNSAGGVTRWNDLSGNNAHAVNATGIRLPTYESNALSGMGALRCEPTNGITTAYGQYLLFPRVSTIRTVFSVFKGSSFLLTDSGSAYHFHRPNDTDPAAPLWTGYTSDNIKNGSTYVNGNLITGTTYAMPTLMNKGFNLVDVLTTGNVYADGFDKDRNVSRSGFQSHAEVLIYDRVLTEAERLQNEGYLMSKWLPDFPVLPTGSTLTVLSGGVLDLNGHSQEVATLKGNGSVSNGTLVVANAIDLTNEVTSAIAVNGSLTMKPGAALRVDHTTSASDVVNVSGTLKIEGANTVRLNTLSGAMPPFRVTLFSFGTLDGQENLSSWTVDLPPALQNYETRFHAENNQVYVNVFLTGTMIHLK
jgi:autotransporter-associated beta strand protein